jgi:hypothetical protein
VTKKSEEEEERGRQRDKAGEEASEWCGPSNASGRMSSSISANEIHLERQNREGKIDLREKRK